MEASCSPAERAARSVRLAPVGRRWPVATAVAVLALAAATALRYGDVVARGAPGVLLQGTLPLERSDQLLHAWILDWVYHQLAHRPWRLFDANIFYPHPYPLALSDHLFGVAATLVPLRALVADPLRLNVLGTALTFVLAGTAVWVLVTVLTRDAMAGLVAGLLYAFNPFRSHNLDQVQLLTDYAMPLCFLALHRYQRSGRGRALLALGAAFAWQLLCSAYLAAYLALPLALAFLAGVARGRPARGAGWRWYAAAAGAVVLLAGPFLYPYARLQATLDLRQHIMNSIAFSLPLDALACRTGCNPLAGPTLSLALVLAAVALWPDREAERGVRSTYVIVAGTAVVLAFGPYVHWRTVADQTASPGFLVPGPYLLLHTFVPGFDGLRAPVRAIAVYHFALAVLAGLGVARLGRALGRPVLRGACAAALIALALLQAEPAAVRFEPVPGTAGVPPVYRWLAAQPSEPVIELPMRGFGDLFTYYSSFHRHPLVNGYSGVLPLSYRYIEASMDCYPCAEALDVLADLGVRTHVVHLELVGPGLRPALRQRIAAEPALHVVREFGTTLVVRSARAARPPVTDGLEALDRRGWRATSSGGARGVERAFDASPDTFWSTAMPLEDLADPVAGMRLLRGLRSGADFLRLVPQGPQWFQIDLGAVESVRRTALVFAEWTARLPAPAPALEGSLDGVTWFPLSSEARVLPSVRAFARAGRRAHLAYEWPATRLRHLRVDDAGYWSLYDVAVFR